MEDLLTITSEISSDSGNAGGTVEGTGHQDPERPRREAKNKGKGQRCWKLGNRCAAPLRRAQAGRGAGTPGFMPGAVPSADTRYLV